jgi:hypothetical protein
MKKGESSVQLPSKKSMTGPPKSEAASDDTDIPLKESGKLAAFTLEKSPE